MDFEKICMLFTMQEPFYGILLSSMDRVPDKNVTDTLAIGRVGNVFKLFYNPDFVGKFNVDTTIELLRHEVLHVAFNHMSILEDKGDGQEIHKLKNIAMDAEVNCYLNRNKMQPEVGGIWANDFGFGDKLGTRAYYDLFLAKMQQQQQQQQAQNPTKPCNGGQGGNEGEESQQSDSGDSQNDGDGQSNSPQESTQSHNSGQGTPSESSLDKQMDELMKSSFDSHKSWPKLDNEMALQDMQEMIDTMLLFAADEVEKGCGNIPGELVGRIEKLRKKPKPVADWRKYFRRYLGNEFTDLIKKSRKRESKRFPGAAGNRHQRKSNILVAIDTSGSVSMPEYLEFFGQIKTLQERASFHVVECDSEIQHEYDYKGKPNETLHGGGGTSFVPPIELYLKNRKKYDALVYFTDGESWVPDNTPKETLWVISSRGDHDRKRYKVNGASVVIIPKKN